MIRKPLVVLAVLALAASLSPAAAAAASKPSSRSCFWTRDVRNYVAEGVDVLNLRVGVRDVWRMDLLGPCNNIDWPTSLAIRARGGSGMICSPLDAEIIYRASPMPPQTCLVRSLHRLTPQEVSALPKRARP